MTTEGMKEGSQSPPKGLFTNTHWSLVLRAQDQSETALNSLFASYRPPLIIWLRARRYSPHDAEDLVNGFCEKLLMRNFLKSVAQEKGKFRSFLLVSLKNYLNDVRKKKTVKPLFSFNETNGDARPPQDPPETAPAPDMQYDRAWAQTVLDNSLRRLEAECARTGHKELCTALEPCMFADETAAPYAAIGERLGMSEGAVKVAAHRIRARLRGIIREEVLQTVDNEEDLEEEIHYLISLFGN